MPILAPVWSAIIAWSFKLIRAHSKVLRLQIQRAALRPPVVLNEAGRSGPHLFIDDTPAFGLVHTPDNRAGLSSSSSDEGRTDFAVERCGVYEVTDADGDEGRGATGPWSVYVKDSRRPTR